MYELYIFEWKASIARIALPCVYSSMSSTTTGAQVLVRAVMSDLRQGGAALPLPVTIDAECCQQHNNVLQQF
jgi:hypothetical protein